jgi:hypothetical protein
VQYCLKGGPRVLSGVPRNSGCYVIAYESTLINNSFKNEF